MLSFDASETAEVEVFMIVVEAVIFIAALPWILALDKTLSHLNECSIS